MKKLRLRNWVKLIIVLIILIVFYNIHLNKSINQCVNAGHSQEYCKMVLR